MTKEQALSVFVDLFNNGSHQSYEVTRSYAVIVDDQVEIRCKQDPARNYHLDDVVRIAAGLSLSTYAKVENNELVIVVF